MTWLQFLSSLLKWRTLLSVGTTGFLVVILFTLLFGRVYCASFHPLGILQNVINHLHKKNKFKYLKPKTLIKNLFFFLPVLLFLLGFPWLLGQLDPYSFFGRSLSILIQPLLIEGNNILFSAGTFKNQTFLFSIPQPALTLAHIIWVSLLAISLLSLIWKYGRLWCNTVCPVKYPFKAILVKTNKRHQTAQMPVEKKLLKPKPEDDFPF